MTDSQFLFWLKDRVVYAYGESENMDFVTRLGQIANKLEKKENVFKDEE